MGVAARQWVEQNFSQLCDGHPIHTTSSVALLEERNRYGIIIGAGQPHPVE
jgi:hypothetical protein